MKTGEFPAGLREDPQTDPFNSLTQINLDDLVASFGWEKYPFLARMLRRTFAGPARTFAADMLSFDDDVGALGLAQAGRRMLGKYIKQTHLYAAEIPAGPILALSNHPGMADTLALFAALDRPDLKIIALDRPFLRSLPNTSRQLLYVQDDPAARMSLVRQVSEHLRSGGAALTFPSGEIEPDPAVYPGALDALCGWTESVGVFVRMAPETAILPTLVRGVIWDRTAGLIFLRLKKAQEDREKLAAAFQLLAHLSLPRRILNITVQVGRPITVTALGSRDTQVIHQAVLGEMTRLIENPPVGKGVALI